MHGTGAKVLPVQNGASVDATIDLGQSSRRFKDLHLSGTISSGAITSSGTITSSGQFTSASGDASFRRAGSSTARIRIESGNTFSDQSFAVNGSIKTVSYTHLTLPTKA